MQKTSQLLRKRCLIFVAGAQFALTACGQQVESSQRNTENEPTPPAIIVVPQFESTVADAEGGRFELPTDTLQAIRDALDIPNEGSDSSTITDGNNVEENPGITTALIAGEVLSQDDVETADVEIASLGDKDVAGTEIGGGISDAEVNGNSVDSADEASDSIFSDEQDFDAVAERESIESDAARRQEQQANRVDFLPEEIPETTGIASVAEFAFATNNGVGNPIYNRFGSFLTRFSLNERCAEFGSDFEAQQAFLDAGGPKTDKLLLDPDGDGFACDWTPEIYRNMIK